MDRAVAIIPAFNEGARVAPVVRAALAAACFNRVLVVDDGSRDDTAAQARAAGAEVLTLRPNRGKGGAMREGVRATFEPVVVFLDADLVGLRPDHPCAMTDPVRAGAYGMVVGLRDYGAARNALQPHFPVITGERAVRRELLGRVPASLWRGYDIEVAINDAVARAGGRAGAVVFDGIKIVDRIAKDGAAKGTAALVDMGVGIARSMREIRAGAARPTDLPPPATMTAKCDSLECVMDEVTGSLVRNAGPMVRDEIVPAVLGNLAAVETFGEACGRGAARELGIWVKLAAGLSAFAAGLTIYDHVTQKRGR